MELLAGYLVQKISFWNGRFRKCRKNCVDLSWTVGFFTDVDRSNLILWELDSSLNRHFSYRTLFRLEKGFETIQRFPVQTYQEPIAVGLNGFWVWVASYLFALMSGWVNLVRHCFGLVRMLLTGMLMKDFGSINPALYQSMDSDDNMTFPEGHVGRLWFQLAYERDSEKLICTIVKAKNLSCRPDKSLCDPFVRLVSLGTKI